ncbi:GNAT family N-acetyltransferase [Paenibacillus phocaensis]|uniref:GNAT family N-acetyltransferase n=1 Tax=Paenibacillus phocaensis TaxID=1776378 RepID=UPI0003A949C9|nr:GNAT family N-acetyltransferase [Paenibacillus phocaensis]
MNLRILEEREAAIYQSLRLHGLKDNPEAFGSTYEREAAFSLETVEDRIRPDEDRFVLGAFDEHGTLMGIVTFIRDKSPKIRHKGNVFGMYVTPGMRGKGVGRALMRELLVRAKQLNGLEQLNLTVVSANGQARRLYESVGFRTFGTERRALKWDGVYFDEDYMALRLRE